MVSPLFFDSAQVPFKQPVSTGNVRLVPPVTKRETRRHFLTRSGTVATLAMRGLRAQPQQTFRPPGIEAGEPIKSLALQNVTVIDGTGKPATRPG